ncbi:MAG TPA: DNA/RNA non-specific endonuclease [Bacteroidales bacterium]
MKNSMLTILIALATFTLTFAQSEPITINGKKALPNGRSFPTIGNRIPQNNNKTTTITHLEIPKTLPNDIIIRHAGYSLLYDEHHEQAKWVAYELTSAETHKVAKRTNKFLPDPLVKTNSANDSDYAGSGYDRGHLAPAGDMGWSSVTMAESFYYSNMSPQVPAFNRGIWKRLEELVRTWTIEYNAVYVVTGPVLTKDLSAIGPDEVSVPKYFYKVILDYTGQDIKGIGFILPNAGSGNPLQNYAVTIDSVEKFTGIDFFPALPDLQEEQIENSLCIPCWSWSRATK